MITCELIQLQSAPSECFKPSAMPSIKTKEYCMISGENYSNRSEKVSVGKKRKSTEMVEQQNNVDIIMNLSRKRQCSAVLKKLRTHKFGWLFSVPVDPIKLKIPDYFSIISKPMDLGTVEEKLEKQLYLSTSKFAADVRLTFSNAMRYNPPDNPVHGCAKVLNHLFDSSWKELELKWRKCSVTSTPASVMKSHSQSSTKGANNDVGSGLVRCKTGLVDEKTWKSNHPHVDAERRCCQQYDSTQASTSDLDSERSHGRENFLSDSNTSKLDCKKTIADQKEYSSSNSGPAFFDGDNVIPTHHYSLAVPRAANDKHDLPCEEKLSPNRARRAALLKQRFKDTILKANQNTLLNGEKGDPIRMQQEKKKLEKKHQEEMARIEQAKVAEAAAQIEAEIALKMQLQKEREAARMAVEQMGKTADTDENGWVLKELKNLGCLRPVYTLEKLGLFIKDDTVEEEIYD